MVGAALDEMLGEAAERLGVAHYVPFLDERAGAQDAADAWSLIGRGWVLERTGQLKEAAASLTRAADMPGAASVAPVLAAYCRLMESGETGNWDAARASWDREALWGEFGPLADALAALADGGPDGAEAPLGLYLRQYPRSPRAQMLLGVCRERTGAPPAEALAAYQRAVELDVGYMPAARAAGRIIARTQPRLLDRYLTRWAEAAGIEADRLDALKLYCEQHLKTADPAESQ